MPAKANHARHTQPKALSRDRVTIVDACRDPHLFGPWFRRRETWGPWFSFLAALFGLPMDAEQRALFTQHSGRTQLPTAQAREGWLCVGRRGGKSFVVAHDIVRQDGSALASGSETRVWGRYADGPGSPLKGETIPESLKALFRAT